MNETINKIMQKANDCTENRREALNNYSILAPNLTLQIIQIFNISTNNYAPNE